MKNIVLIGGGGHCKAAIDVIEQEGRFKISGIVDKSSYFGSEVNGYSIIGNDLDLMSLAKIYKNALVTVGQIKSPALRIKLYHLALKAGFIFPTIISPRSYVSKHSAIGNGTIIMHDALINTNAKVGDNCIINSKALIEHDAIINNHCHISTGSIVNGGAVIEEKVFLGSNATTIEMATLKSGLVLEAGAVVKK